MQGFIYARKMTKADYNHGKISDPLTMIERQITCNKNLRNELLGLLSKSIKNNEKEI
jgi:hypothetical protein